MAPPFVRARENEEEDHEARLEAASLLHDTSSDDTLLLALAFVDEFQLSSSTTEVSPPLLLPEELLTPEELVSQELLAQVLNGEFDQHLQPPPSDIDGGALRRSLHMALTEADGVALANHAMQEPGGAAEPLLYKNNVTDTSWFAAQAIQQQQSAELGMFAPIESHNKSSKKTKTTKKQQQETNSKSSGGIAGAKQAAAPKMPNKARDERKAEIIYLRKKMVELEEQLTETKSRHKYHQTQSSSPDGDAASQLSPELLGTPPSVRSATTDQITPPAAKTGVWHEIACRQHTQRAKAERENVRLKLVLETQLKVAKSLEKVLQKTARPKDFGKLLYGNRPPHSVDLRSQATDGPSEGHRLFEELLARMDQSYAEAESIFEAHALAQNKTSSLDAAIRSDESVGIQLEVFANKVLPFDMRAAGAAVWHHYVFAKERLPNRVYHHNSPQTLNATEDTVLEDFNVELDVNNTNGLFRVKMVLRRYTEENRVVIVWRAFFDPLRIADEPTPGVRVLERGYIILKELSVGTLNNVLQTCYIATPIMTGDLANADSGTIRTITDFMLNATASNITSSHEMIENVLLEHTRNG